jgi:hypothetical protein
MASSSSSTISKDDERRLGTSSSLISLYGDALPSSLKSMILSLLPLRSHLRLSRINKLWLSASKRHESKPMNGSYTIKSPSLVIMWLQRLLPFRPVSLTLSECIVSEAAIDGLVSMSASLRSLACLHTSSPDLLQRLPFLTSLSLNPKTHFQLESHISLLPNLLHYHSSGATLLDNATIEMLPRSLHTLDVPNAMVNLQRFNLLMDRVPSLTHLGARVTPFAIPDDKWLELLKHPNQSLQSVSHLFDDVPPSVLASLSLPLLTNITITIQRSGSLEALSIAAPSLTQINQLNLGHAVHADDLKSIPSFKSLTRLALTTSVASSKVVSYLPLTGHCLTSLDLICPAESLTYDQIRMCSRLTSLSLTESKHLTRNTITDPRYYHTFPGMISLPYISLKGYQALSWQPFISSIPVCGVTGQLGILYLTDLQMLNNWTNEYHVHRYPLTNIALVTTNAIDTARRQSVDRPVCTRFPNDAPVDLD